MLSVLEATQTEHVGTMFLPGSLFDEQYRIVRELGAGGQGTVFEAQDLQSGEFVAIKVMNKDVAEKSSLAERMRREVHAMSVLSGTAAVKVHALKQTPATGQMYIVMELLRGNDLEQAATRFEQRFGSVPIRTVIELLSPIIDTLEAAHARSIVHRDIKPSNIFVLDVPTDSRGRVRLLDFGMVKDLSATVQVTRQGAVLGSPAYVAPEAWRDSSSGITPATDVYSMGVVLYRMLAGRIPFQGESRVDIAIAVMRGPRPSLHAERLDLPKAIDRWSARTLAIDPAQRFQSVREMWNEVLPLIAPAR